LNLDFASSAIVIASLTVPFVGCVSLFLSVAVTAALGSPGGSVIRLSVLPAVWFLVKPTINAAKKWFMPSSMGNGLVK
jgi:hypothetical protein